MEAKSFEGKHIFKEKAYKEGIIEEDIDDETEEEDVGGAGELGFANNEKKKKGVSVFSRRGSTGGASPPCCQAQGCGTNLTEAKRYHRRHKVCEFHSKASAVIVGGLHQRFCQQCSRFHELTEFDEAKRSCRRRLAGHNERRRKNTAENHGECSMRKGPIPQAKEGQCWHVDDHQRGSRIHITPTGNSGYKQYHII